MSQKGLQIQIPEVVMRARFMTRMMLLFMILSACAQAQVVVTDDANTTSSRL
jgi:hypothetical protein